MVIFQQKFEGSEFAKWILGKGSSRQWEEPGQNLRGKNVLTIERQNSGRLSLVDSGGGRVCGVLCEFWLLG